MKLKSLTIALACALPTSATFAAALDRSGQSVSAFLQPDNYFEAGVGIIAPEVTGVEAGTSTTTRQIDKSVAKEYVSGTLAVKFQPAEKFSFGVIYDQPFGANASYTGENVFVASGNDTILPTSTLTALSSSAVPAAAATVFNNMTAEQRVGAALQAQGVDLTSTAGQARFAQTLAAYNADATTKATIDAAVQAGVTQQVGTRVATAINTANGALAQEGGTKVKIHTDNLSFLFGYQPTNNWNIYAGPVLQRTTGNVSLRGQAYSLYNGYDAKINGDDSWGWLAGVAYQIPDIALKASLTYRSKIEYDTQFEENLSALNAVTPIVSQLQALGGAAAAAKLTNAQNQAGSTKTKFEFPQSVNLDFQTGVAPNTLAFANVRWVNWKDWAIRPYLFGQVSEVLGPAIQRPNGFDLVKYSKDQWSANVGVGRKFSDKWSGSASLGWDSGAGNPVTTLGPTEGFYNAGLGAQYSPAKNYFVQGGVRYMWLGDAKAQTGAQFGGDAHVASYTKNHAIAGGLKVGYRF